MVNISVQVGWCLPCCIYVIHTHKRITVNCCLKNIKNDLLKQLFECCSKSWWQYASTGTLLSSQCGTTLVSIVHHQPGRIVTDPNLDTDSRVSTAWTAHYAITILQSIRLKILNMYKLIMILNVCFSIFYQ